MTRSDSYRRTLTREQIEHLRYQLTGSGPDADEEIHALCDMALASLNGPSHEGWKPIESAPKDETTVLLNVPTLYGKWNETIAVSGRWEPRDNGAGFWIIFNADEAVQRVEPTHWMPVPSCRTTRESMEPWMMCLHRFVPWFGPVLRCRLCGATTMVSMDPKESKPIFPPSKYEEPTNG